MISYKGTTIQGGGFAHRTLPIQFQYFVWFYSVLGNVQTATINIKLYKPFLPAVHTFDHIQTRQIRWTPNFPPEHFKFYPCNFILDGQWLPAFIYESSLSGHRLSRGYVVEIVTRPVSVRPGMPVEIQLQEGVPGWFVNRGRVNNFFRRLLDKFMGITAI